MPTQNFNDPILIQFHINEITGEKYLVEILNESKKIINGVATLNQLPDKFNKVVISGMTEVNEYEEVNSTNKFKVDYTNGMIFFHSSRESQTVNINKYFGRGIVLYPASRVYMVNNDWNSNNLDSLTSEIKQNINSVNNNHIAHLNSQSAHSSNNLNNQSSVSGVKITDALNTLKTNYDDHLANTSAHKDDSVDNTSVVAGGKVKDALNNLKIRDDQLNARIDNIVAQSGNSNSEIVDARNSARYGSFASVDARLEGLENRSKYFARQVATIQQGAKTITLTHTPENNHELLIYDNTYGCIWLKDLHWTRSGNVITFTEVNGLPETLSFTIYNLG